MEQFKKMVKDSTFEGLIDAIINFSGSYSTTNDLKEYEAIKILKEELILRATEKRLI